MPSSCLVSDATEQMGLAAHSSSIIPLQQLDDTDVIELCIP
jgi:hypothetical protein